MYLFNFLNFSNTFELTEDKLEILNQIEKFCGNPVVNENKFLN